MASVCGPESPGHKDEFARTTPRRRRNEGEDAWAARSVQGGWRYHWPPQRVADTRLPLPPASALTSTALRQRQAPTPHNRWKCASDPTATLRGVAVSRYAAYEADCHRS
eukprot:6198161-Pleurochrysis_carterae.AAC.9